MALNVAVIGTGWGKYIVAPAYESLGCDVELVSPRDGEAVREAVVGECDLVSIHSPPFMHVEHVELAVANKRAVLCDKPFGRNATESARMLELANGAGVLHFLNFEFRFDTLRAKMKELLDTGAIGDPVHLSNTMYYSMGHRSPHGWLFENDKGGGWIGAYASHQVDMLHWLFGEIDALSCRPRIDVVTRPDRDDPGGPAHEATAEDALTAWFRMENGVTASIDTSCSSAVDLSAQTTLLGTEGALRLTDNSELVLQRPGQEPERFSNAAENPGAAAQAHWLAKVCEAIGSGQQTGPDFTDGLACARVLDRMRNGRQ
jgi:predicted dehydrogenase